MDLKQTGENETIPDSARVPLPPRWQRLVLNLLCLLILGTIGWCNLPDEIPQQTMQAVDRQFSPETAYRIRWGEWVWKWWAHLAGLDNKWQMYGLQSRFNWRYEIIATYGSGPTRVERLLPLPRQSERTTWQRRIVDFKEAKFHLNIYNDPLARETYAHYLARQFPEHAGQRLERIRYDLKYQFILPPLVAIKEQQLLEDWVQTDTVSDFELSQVVTETLGPRTTPLLPEGLPQTVNRGN